MKNCIIAITLLLFTLEQAYSQEEEVAAKKITRKERKALKIKNGEFLISPFIGPGYSPELGFSIAGGMLISFRSTKSDTTLLRSSAPISVTFSSTGAFIFNSNLTSYWLKDKLRIYGTLQIRNMPDHYFGVGYEDGLYTDFPDSTEYDRKYFQLQAKPVWKVSKDLFLGFNYDYNSTRSENVNPHMAKDSFFVAFGDDIKNVGLGPVISYDSRDFPQNPYKGSYVTLTYTRYGIGGSDYDYKVADFDIRKYVSVGEKAGRVFAFNLRGRYTIDDAPYPELSYVGSPYDLRGYRMQRFRDKAMNYFLAEYRHKFHGKSFFGSRSGFVVWSGVGSIGPDFSNALYQNSLPNFGIGYRFEVEPRLNVRIDFGIGRDSQGIYFNFQEAF